MAPSMSLRDIAKKLGLSVTTVSRALADYDDVADETRRRVRAEAQRIGYVPNAIARRLQKGRADAIGIAAPSGFGVLEDSFLSQTLVGAWSRLAERDQDLLLLPIADLSPAAAERDAHAFGRAIAERRVDGMILIRPRRNDPRIDTLVAADMPFVMIDCEMDDRPDVVGIGIDEEAAATQVCRRLAALGHRRLVCVGPEEDFDFVLARFEHFERATTALGLEMERATAPSGATGGRSVTARLLETHGTPPPPLVYLTNRMAIGGMSALGRGTLRTRDDVTVIAYGDSQTLRHALATTIVVRPPTHDMARHAVDALLARLDGKPFETTRRWMPTIEPAAA